MGTTQSSPATHQYIASTGQGMRGIRSGRITAATM